MININTINDALNLKLKDSNEFFEISTDTRKFKDGSVFLAISGENYNAVDFAESVLEKKCRIFIYKNSDYNNKKIDSLKNNYPKTEFCPVIDEIFALQKISSFHLDKWKNDGGKLFVISGSNGKTTNKEMLSFILEDLYPNQVVKTLKNNNNHIGVPLTILELNSKHKFLVLELGSNHPGEMKVLCDICKPKMGFVTNIGETHLEFFESLENVFKEETVCFDYIKKSDSGFFLKNNFDEFLSKLNSENSLSIGLVDSDFKVELFSNKSIMHFNGEEFQISNDYITGKHNFFNLTASIIIASKLTGIDINKIIKIAAEFKPRDNRSQWIKLGETKIFLDAYNANPSSMIVAIEGFKNSIQDISEALIVIGDMNELGNKAEEGHAKVAKFLKDNDFKNIVFIGRYYEYFRKAIDVNIEHYDNAKSYYEKFINNDSKKYKFILLKASRSLQLEQLIDIK